MIGALLVMLAVPVAPLTIDAVLIGSTAYLDVATTKWALERCPSCSESNMLATSRSSQSVLHVVGFAGIMAAQYALRTHGHKAMADGVRWGTVATFLAVAVSNAHHARRGR